MQTITLRADGAVTASLDALRRRAALGLALAWGALAVCAAFAVAAGWPPRAPLQSAVAFALVSLLVWRWLPQHLPQRRFGAANGVSLTRAAGVALLTGLLGIETAQDYVWPALLLGLLLLLLDGVDGWLARRLHSASAFGARFDMETDSLFVMVLALLVWQFDKAGVWILLAGLLRYAFVTAGRALPALRRPLAPSLRRKTVCVVQVAGLLACLCPLLSRDLSAPLALLTLALLTLSFGLDVRALLRRPRDAPDALG